MTLPFNLCLWAICDAVCCITYVVLYKPVTRRLYKNLDEFP